LSLSLNKFYMISGLFSLERSDFLASLNADNAYVRSANIPSEPSRSSPLGSLFSLSFLILIMVSRSSLAVIKKQTLGSSAF